MNSPLTGLRNKPQFFTEPKPSMNLAMLRLIGSAMSSERILTQNAWNRILLDNASHSVKVLATLKVFPPYKNRGNRRTLRIGSEVQAFHCEIP